jgi:GNAT superfamily N-acetyltransferase
VHQAVPVPDAVIELGGFTFAIEWKSSSGVAWISSAARQARAYASALGGPAIPLVAVPFMGPVGRERCEEAGIGWLDLSGNARIFAPGIRVRIDGQPNRFKRPGRPSSAFAPKSARIARWLLMHPDRAMTQREIARATDMDEGFTSRIVAKLVEDDLVVRDPDGAIRARDPGLLLDAWRADYDFSKHRVLGGHVPSRSGHALLQRLVEALRKRGDRYAATGLAAAWLLTRFAGFRIVTIYLPEQPAPALLEHLGFREGARGANAWLVVPNDEGVFHGASDRDEIRCVHPVQAYIDLKEHPERANEAAEQLRAELLSWSADG